MYEWTGTAYQEQAAAGQTGVIMALAVLFACLFLGALSGRLTGRLRSG